MTPHIFTVALLAGAAVAAACAVGPDNASAFEMAAKAQKAPSGYHLDGFRGWGNGYPVSYRACAPVGGFKPGLCVPGRRIFQLL